MSSLHKFLLLVILLTPLTSAVSVGVSPGFIDMGDFTPGTTQEISFYITTNSQEEFSIDPKYESSLNFIGPEAPISMQNVSEQDIGTWITWTQDTYTIDPNTTNTYTLPDGSSVNAEGQITMEVSVPPNTEPGYRIGDIRLEPGIEAGAGGAGARLLAQTIPTFAFRVPGDVRRDIDVTGFQALRIGENNVQMILQLRNTGTVTTRFNGAETEVFDQFGSKVGEVSFDSAPLAPGEYAEIDSTWGSRNIEGGEYEVEGKGDYRTGETYISGEFAITDVIQERQSVEEPSGGDAEKSVNEAPFIMILIISVLLATILYLVDVDPVWIIMLSAGSAASLYILLGSTANALVLIPIVSLFIMLYV